MDEDEAANRPEPSTGQTGFVYDDKLSRHYCAWNSKYTERPERIKECYSRMQQLGLVGRCVNIPVRPATDEEVGLCHSKKHMDMLKETQFMTTEQLGNFSRSYDFVYFHKTVEENARLALGGAIDLVEQIVTGKLQNGMAVIRPPGHHAMTEEYSGYCYFNNVAVAARTAMEKHGLKRVLILDWDVHHGQGTQFDFYEDPRVLFFSMHRYEHGIEWPHMRESDYDYVGEGAGRGFNFNIPLNECGCDNSDYLSIFFSVVLPVAYEFQPELVLVSAGYDSAIGCPEGEMSVSPACFAHFVNLLKPLAAGRIALLMEGGYCLKTLAEGAALSLRALLGDPTPNIAPISQPRPSVVESVLNVVKVQRAVHPSLAYQDTMGEGEDQIHTWQSHSPPQSRVKLRTRDDQPDQFPLLQECCEDMSEATEAAINQQIEQLERDTVIARTQHRLGLLHYQLAELQNNERTSMEETLLQNGLLSGCHKLSVSSSGSEVSTAVAAILADTVQSCVMLPCSSSLQGVSLADFEDVVKSAATCLQSDFDVKRTLFLNIASQSQTSIVGSAASEDGRSLVISLGPHSQVEEEHAGKYRPYPVNIPLSQSQLKDADVIAAVQQVVLPIAYEFGPDFVVVCLGLLSQDSSCGEPGLSAACMGHVMAVMQGLARGRLLLLVTPEAAEQNMETVAECVSVLQGRPCQPLAPCVPQQSTVELIKVVQDKQKAAWKTLQFRVKLPAPR